MQHRNIKTYLEKLEATQESFDSSMGEHAIAEEIGRILEHTQGYQPTNQDIAEKMAFDFIADYRDEKTGWGTYYGPMWILPNDEGRMVEYPSFRMVDREKLMHWKIRANESKHPVLVSRYADLVVDFSLVAVKEKPSYRLVEMVIDSNVKICQNAMLSPLDCKTRAKRALDLAILYNNRDRIGKVVKAVIGLEESIANDNLPGLWGFSLRWLVLEHKDKVFLGEGHILKLVQDIEKRLKRVGGNGFLVENAALLLAEYYAAIEDEKNLMRILSILEHTLKSDERIQSNALLIHSMYERLLDTHTKYSNTFPRVQEATERLKREITNIDLDWENSMKTITTETSIKRKDISAFLDVIFGKGTSYDLSTILSNIALSCLPSKNFLKKELEDNARKYPMLYKIPQTIISNDKDNVPVSNLGSLEDDYDGHLKRHTSIYLQFDSVKLLFMIDRLKNEFPKQEIAEFIGNAMLFRDQNQDYIKRAISAYWDHDYLVASHLFAPLIEATFRELMKVSGGIWLVLDEKHHRYNRYTLSKILWNRTNAKIIEDIFPGEGDDFLFYLRLTLIEPLGLNLRDDFAHGVGKEKFLKREPSDRLFHILVCLALVTDQPLGGQ